MNRLFRTTVVEISGVRTIAGGGTNASDAGQALLNLSGVSIAGDQTIDGSKNFTSRPTVNGVGVLTFDDSEGLVAENIIYTTGDLDIFDEKRFENATNLENSPFLYSGLGKYTENYFTAFFSGNSGVYESPITRNTVVFLNIETGQEHDIYLPSISNSVENDTIKYVIASAYEENIFINTYDDENNPLISGEFTYQPKFTLNFKTSGIDENGDYTDPFNLESINSFVKNDSISFYFSKDNSWGILDKIENNFLPEHSHEIEEIAGIPDLNNLVYTTGNQTISGNKNFAFRPTVDGTGVLTFADTGNFNITVTALLTGENVVFTTGDQTISGNKTFTSVPTVNGIPLSTGSNAEYVFPSDLQVVLSSSKTFGKYLNGQTIPASGKTTSEVIRLAIAENINPTISPFNVNPTSVLIGQTGIINTITFGQTILNPGATLSFSGLEWRRGSAAFQTLATISTNPSLTGSPFVHRDTNTVSDTNSYSYRYIVQDSAGGLTTGSIATVSFLYGNYFGYSTETSLITVAQIEALGNQFLSNSRARTVNGVTANAGFYTYYAYRAGAGDLTSIIQDGAAPVLGAFTKQSDIPGTNLNGASVTYRVYRSNATQAFTNNTLAFS